MSQKGAITITSEELYKMRARANIVPNGSPYLTQQTQSKTAKVSYSMKA